MTATGFSILLVPIFKTVSLALLMGLTVEMMICCTGLFVVRTDDGRKPWNDLAGIEPYQARDRERLDEIEPSPPRTPTPRTTAARGCDDGI